MVAFSYVGNRRQSVKHLDLLLQAATELARVAVFSYSGSSSIGSGQALVEQFHMKKIDPLAYNSLSQALSVVFWHKNPWRRFLKVSLSGAPEILAGLDFEGSTKREVAGQIVDRLAHGEHKYQSLALSLMLALASMDTFPDLDGLDDSERKIESAVRAVSELRKWTNYHKEIVDDHYANVKTFAAAASMAASNRHLSEEIAKLKGCFLDMHQSTMPQKRGKDFEPFLNQLFELFDLEPRGAYSVEREQIDGAFSFDTDDYILEARWWQDPIGRAELDVFAAKVRRKGKNALGLCVSISGFTEDAIEEYSSSTPFITMDGPDVFAVLDERIRLDDLLRGKKRHSNETGACYLAFKDMF